jgi:subtilisin family serine protease
VHGVSTLPRSLAARGSFGVFALLAAVLFSLAGASIAGAASDTDAASDQLIVGFTAGTSASESRSIINDTKSTIERRLPGGVAVVTVDAGATTTEVANDLEANDDVKYATPNYTVHATAITNDPLVQNGSAWSVLRLHAPDAWNVARGDGTIVAVLDGGINQTNPDLAPNLWTNTTEIAGNGADDDNDGFVDNVHGADWVDRDGSPDDPGGHGTHVSGIIAAAADNAVGSAGVAPNAKIMPLRFLDQNGAGNVADALGAIDFAIKHGADVINASWGGPDLSPPLRDALARAGQAGITVVAAAGNDGASNDSAPTYPASFDLPNLISVAASDKSDRLTGFSNYGSTVDVAAPGLQILSTVGGGMGIMSGTSMAAPQVAGIAALLRGYNKGLTPDIVKSAIVLGARKSAPLSGKVRSGGVADAAGALNMVGANVAVTADNVAPGTFKLRKPGKRVRIRGRKGQVRFSWSKASDTDLIGYELTVNGKLRATVTGTHARVTVPAGKVTWSVVAVDADGNKTKAERTSSSSGHISVVKRKPRH